MQQFFKIGFVGTAMAAALAMSSPAPAAVLDTMFIGDSFTYGYAWTDGVNGPVIDDMGTSGNVVQSRGGFRVPLANDLETLFNNNTISNEFNYIGSKGDGVMDYAGVEKSGIVDANMTPDNLGDGFDGAGDTEVARHEGYGGWKITAPVPSDADPWPGLSPGDLASDLTDDEARRGVLQNIQNRTGVTSNEFAEADPTIDVGAADVIMLNIGINDLVGLVYSDINSPSVSQAEIDDVVASMGVLIDEITQAAPDAILLVSNIVPGIENTLPSPATTSYPNNEYNQAVIDFNHTLLSQFFGGVFTPDLNVSDGDTIAFHDIYDNVVLLDAFTAFANDAGTGAETGLVLTRDNLHPTLAGYDRFADFYLNRLVGLGIASNGQLIPEPATAVLCLIGGGLILGGRGGQRRLNRS